MPTDVRWCELVETNLSERRIDVVPYGTRVELFGPRSDRARDPFSDPACSSTERQLAGRVPG
jgi:hypothetical protein